MISRRAFLLTGGASLAVIGAGLGVHIGLQDVSEARAPWEAASKGFGDPRLDAAAYAILAPNPHNRQPWLIKLSGEDRLTLFCDPARLLPETDPPARQITIGLGAFLELLRQAAAEKGYEVFIDPFPEGEPETLLDGRPIAEVVFQRDAGAVKDPLFGYALSRRTVRTPFDAKAVSPEVLEEVAALSRSGGKTAFGWTLEPQRIEKLKTLCHEGWEIELLLGRTHEESLEVTRIGATEVNANPDGIALYGPMMELLDLSGFLTREKLATPGTTAYASMRSFYHDAIASSPAFGWIGTAGNSRSEQLQAGAAWMRVHLAATKAGLAMQPLSQTLQEFPEMAGPFAAVHEELGYKLPGRVQGLFRFGYAPMPGPAPRWPLTSRLVQAA
ncbi:Acg family FMN-binding oxidoreductase [Tepidicaulis sp. LMO-SS28]|uniref:Acg family FMN-binding oxidoreductase n=1 Tax=Tepidicaulis sp. LMO-SS28 TaxID=3447455 RepID=UPI003EE35BFF